MMHKVNEEEFEVLFSPKRKTKSRGASLAHSHTLLVSPVGGETGRWCMCSALRVCLSVSVVGSAEAFFQDNTYACYITTPIRHSLSPSLPNSKLFHLSFSLQQSTNSLSCQSKPTFMQPIINDTIHLARSLSLSSALFLFHPLSLEAPLKAWLPFRVTKTQSLGA